jgi:hypothetical protein
MTKLALTSLILLALIGASSAEAASLKADSTVILSGTSSLLAPLPAPVSYSAGGPNAVDQTGRSWPSSRIRRPQRRRQRRRRSESHLEAAQTPNPRKQQLPDRSCVAGFESADPYDAASDAFAASAASIVAVQLPRRSSASADFEPGSAV